MAYFLYKIRQYVQVIKPGILVANAVTATGAFFMASKGAPEWWMLLWLLVGVALLAASGCIFNNYFDRDIDSLMDRTCDRVFATGGVDVPMVLSIASVILFAGITILFTQLNMLAASLVLVAFLIYVIPYTIILKRHTPYGTLVGSFSGAIPPVAGYAAVTGVVDAGAILLFAILVFWQMPHFYAIAIRRIDDYRRAALPVFPVIHGFHATKERMFAYTAAFGVAAMLLPACGFVGHVYTGFMLVLSLLWLALAYWGFFAKDAVHWARDMFLLSLSIIVAFSILIAFA